MSVQRLGMELSSAFGSRKSLMLCVMRLAGKRGTGLPGMPGRRRGSVTDVEQLEESGDLEDMADIVVDVYNRQSAAFGSYLLAHGQ